MESHWWNTVFQEHHIWVALIRNAIEQLPIHDSFSGGSSTTGAARLARHPARFPSSGLQPRFGWYTNPRVPERTTSIIG